MTRIGLRYFGASTMPGGDAMVKESTRSRWAARLATEDWLAVAVGLILVALVLAGAVTNVP